MNPLRVTQSLKSIWLETPTGRRDIPKLGQRVAFEVVQRRFVEFRHRMPKRPDFSVTSKEARSGNNGADTSESVDLARNGLATAFTYERAKKDEIG
jgi:hypothetical protein